MKMKIDLQQLYEDCRKYTDKKEGFTFSGSELKDIIPILKDTELFKNTEFYIVEGPTFVTTYTEVDPVEKLISHEDALNSINIAPQPNPTIKTFSKFNEVHTATLGPLFVPAEKMYIYALTFSHAFFNYRFHQEQNGSDVKLLPPRTSDMFKLYRKLLVDIDTEKLLDGRYDPVIMPEGKLLNDIDKDQIKNFKAAYKKDLMSSIEKKIDQIFDMSPAELVDENIHDVERYGMVLIRAKGFHIMETDRFIGQADRDCYFAVKSDKLDAVFEK